VPTAAELAATSRYRPLAVPTGTQPPRPENFGDQRRIELIVVLNLFDIIPGREKEYAEYLRRVQPILSRHGAKILVYGLTRMVYFGNCNQQYCGLIVYPDIEAFKSFSGDPEFREIRPLRDDSTTHYVLTVIEDFETLNHAVAFLENGGQEQQQEHTNDAK